MSSTDSKLIAKAKKRRAAPAKRVVAPMTQTTINTCFTNGARAVASHKNVCIVDLFCCIGGFSTGAALAGHRIALAVDNDQIALNAHEANHPNAEHLCLELGPDTEEVLISKIRDVLPKTEDGLEFLPWHLHGSPPCQKFCDMQKTRYPGETSADRDEKMNEAMHLIVWFLSLVERCKNSMNMATWSFEEAPSHKIMNELKEMRSPTRSPDSRIGFYGSTSRSSWFDFELVKLSDFGVPQSRKRLIGGSPKLLDRIRHVGSIRERRVISDVLTPPDGATSIRSVWSADRDSSLDVVDESGETINPNNERRIRLLNELCFVVMAGGGLMKWNDKHAAPMRSVTIQERLLLQTFPPNYNLPIPVREQQRGIGNAVPPLFAQKLMSNYT
jgi:site-specific DNA-cytosine methylase